MTSLGKLEQLIAVPDSAAGARLTEVASLDVLMTYESGRPAIIGSKVTGRSWSYSIKGRSLLAIGSLPQQIPTSILNAFEKAQTVDDFDSMSIPGSFALAIRIGRRIRFQGTISSLRQVHWCRFNGEVVAATESAVLASLTGLQPDLRALTRWMITPHAPHPLNTFSAWEGVRTVPPGSYLVTESGRAESISYWHPIRPDQSFEASARGIRERLAEAIETRVNSPFPLTSDASGGIDSTIVLSLAAQQRSDICAFTTGPSQLLNDDLRWAALAIDNAGIKDWIRSEGPDFPEVFSRIDGALIRTDEPFAGEALKMRTHFIAQRLSKDFTGSFITHLTGRLGDELFSSGISHLRDLKLSRIPEVIDRIGLLHARTRQSRGSLWGWANSRAPYSVAFQRFLRDGHMSPGWHTHEIKIPEWINAASFEQFSDGFDTTVDVSARGETAEQHETLVRVSASGELLRHEMAIMANQGVFLEVPLGDDRVLESVFHSPIGSLQDPRTVKRIFTCAAAGLMPGEIERRTTKVDSTRLIWTGFANHKQALQRVSTDMLVGHSALIDEPGFARSLFGPHPPSLSPMSLWRTLSVEVWLRDLQNMRPVI
ncbi:asparagine synthase (glutamine-hydrolyzing) [Mycetocola sp. BIGb0189]|uniref:asparagine synthase-related protein n=1 Tax=Mycetocola sp. BIGb0189 TaxID=2940604 RepID=UPI00216A6E37|nr:asparagine synthase-related protein [Mycetocola sp. BIGb0189]MCS4274929.1 asparagine synthase (glutamine-hydrolyzing) [Mycetocola sp. BIGb0189]